MSFPLINPISQFFDSSGAPLDSGTIEFRNPATDAFINSYPTADDADAQTNANANPLTLNARGEAADGLYLEDGVKYKIILKDSTGATIWTEDDVRCPIFSATSIGERLYPITAAETTAGVTPTSYVYPAGYWRRYGAVGDGSTDDRAAAVLADSIGIETIVDGGLDYAVATSLTLTNPVRIDAKSTLKPSSGSVITFSSQPVINHRETAFTGDGTVVFSEPQEVWADWWDRSVNTCIQEAVTATAQGSKIKLFGKYTTNGISLTSDEANQTGDIGKSIVGVGGPGTRIRDKVTGNWGAEIYLADSQDVDVISMVGTAQNGGSSRFSVTLDNFKINGNKGNQSSGNGLHLSYVKDLWIGTLLIEDCKDNGLDDTNANNQIDWGYLEVQNSGNDGINLGATADSQFGVTKTATNGRFGLSVGAGHFHFNTIHAYLNGEEGVVWSNIDSSYIGYLRCNDNDEAGLRINNADGLYIGKLATWNNGQDAAATATDRTGLRILGTTAACVIDHHQSYDDQRLDGTHDGSSGAAIMTDSTASFTVDGLIGLEILNVTDGSSGVITDNDATTVTATLSGGTDDDWDASDVYAIGSLSYHAYITSTGVGNRIGSMDYDSNALVDDIVITAAGRNSVTIDQNIKQTSAVTTGSVELNPQLGDLVFTATLTGAVDLDYTTNTKVPNGHKQQVIIHDGGGQNITLGTNVTAIATAPTPATDAKHLILDIRYHDGEAFLTETHQEA